MPKTDAKKRNWESYVAGSINENSYGLVYKLRSGRLKIKEVLTMLSHNQEYTETNINTINNFSDLGAFGWR